MYKEFLYYMCKWATKGLDGEEMKAWHKLINKLDKECKACKEGHICEDCHDTGLNLTGLETMLLRNIEMSLDANRVHSVN